MIGPIDFKCETGPGSSEELPVPFQESPPGFSFTAFAVRFKVVVLRDCDIGGHRVAGAIDRWPSAVSDLYGYRTVNQP